MQTIAGLLLRRLQGILNESEAAALAQWLAEQPAERRKFYEEVTDWPAIERALHAMYRIDESTALNEVWTRIRMTTVKRSPVALRRYCVAAAAVALLIGSGMYWLRPHQNIQMDARLPMAARYKSDALPGTNKATLELGDGSIIELDSVGKGELARQHNALILKNESGAVSYQSVNAADHAGIAYNKISTPKGGQYQVVLPDGTQVWLNAASSLRYPTAFTGNARTVELNGEAYFEVAPDAGKHFHVKVMGNRAMEVEVLGTRFNINTYTDEAANATTLVDGKVKVVDAASQAVLQPGQQALVYDRQQQITLQTADLPGILAWKEGLFSLQDADITDIMRQIARWYDVEVIYNGTIKQKFVGKIPRNMKLSEVLKVLESTGWVNFSISGKTVTVAP
ncbi:FecR family protein [Chitinophaga sp.]|uniref:FecR family protein n=1 Tax=Chitinophaga sp. TaxID=1869181 RepID=UPI002F93E8BD